MDEKGRKKDSRSKKRFLQHCGKALLITASYQVFSVCMNPINLQSPQKKSDHGDVMLSDTVSQVSSFFVSPAYGYDIPPVPAPTCEKYYGGGDGNDNSEHEPGPGIFGNLINNLKEIQHQKEINHKQEALNLNEKGISAYKSGDWKAAVDYFTKALRLSPEDKVIRQNLKNAQDSLASKKQRAAFSAEWNAMIEAEQKKRTRQKQKEETLALALQKQEAFDKENNKLGMVLKGGTAEKTIKALKQLHGSVYWGLKAASAALDAKDGVVGNLDDKWALARRYAENSGQAMSGSFVSGSPEFKVSIPDVPPPVEANPQIQLYNYISQQTKKLVPDIIETQKAIEKTKQYSKDIEKKKYENRKEIEPIASKIITTNDPKEKAELVATYEEKNREYDELTVQAKKLEQEAEGLNTKADKQRETYAALQKSNDAAQANPDSAQELLKNLQKK